MSTVITDNRHYSDIADAIRAKGISGTFMPAQMAAAIAVIPSGGGGVVTGTFTVPAPYSIGLTVNHNANIIGDYLFVFWMQQESFEELKLDTSNTKNYVIGAICNCTNSFYDFAENNAVKFNKQGLRWNYTPSSNTHNGCIRHYACVKLHTKHNC